MNRAERHQQLNEEMNRLSAPFPTVEGQLAPDGGGLVTGSLEVANGISYSIRLLVPVEYPDQEPVLFVDPDEIPWRIERHVFEQSGKACLCARSEFRVHWPWGSDLTSFLSNLVHPFFIGQFYYDTHGAWPPTGERSHGKAGILEALAELLQEFDKPSEKQIEKILYLLARKNDPKGHELCPCGSEKRLRSCHRAMIARLRQCVDPRHAQLDLKEAFGSPTPPR